MLLLIQRDLGILGHFLVFFFLLFFCLILLQGPDKVLASVVCPGWAPLSGLANKGQHDSVYQTLPAVRGAIPLVLEEALPLSKSLLPVPGNTCWKGVIPHVVPNKLGAAHPVVIGNTLGAFEIARRQ